MKIVHWLETRVMWMWGGFKWIRKCEGNVTERKRERGSENVCIIFERFG